MPTKKRELKITKFYLLAWIFGLLAFLSVWKNHYLIAGILLMFFVAYSRADYIHPPIEDGKGPDNNDDSGGLAA